MTLVKRKIKRKEFKKPDEFITFTAKILEWGGENLRMVSGVALGFALLLAIVGAIFVFKASREAKATDLYQKALAFYPNSSPGGNNPKEYDQ